MPIHTPTFQAVRDRRKRKIPGLWQRGERYYVQLRVDLGNDGGDARCESGHEVTLNDLDARMY